MGYVIQNTSGLISTRLTDVGRRKISQGNLNIEYFQVGDSEISYTGSTVSPITDGRVLMPAFNAQNNTGFPQSNKDAVKYPFYVESLSGNTYGKPYMESDYTSVYNSAPQRGFFSGDSSCWLLQVCSAYTINTEYEQILSLFDGNVTIPVVNNPIFCDNSANTTPQENDLVTIFYSTNDICSCYNSGSPVLTYQVIYFDGTTLIVDRPLLNYLDMGLNGTAKLIFYPSSFGQLYDTITPIGHWNDDVINFNSLCYTDQLSSLVWNMEIVWSESIAGLLNTTYSDFNYYDSVVYLGTKEYLGYMTSSGQTDSVGTYYFNSYDEKIVVEPEDQKAIAIIHYTNQAVNNFYGEKFATEAYDNNNPNETGQARNFELQMPTLLWHKNPEQSISGETFYIDPNVNGGGFLEQGVLKSTKNEDMNEPGMRYYTLWDNYLNSGNTPSRIGKVFPDEQIVVIDDEEIIAAMSYKSNRNWTLPAPKTTLTPPSICSGDITDTGLLSADTECLWVTYSLQNDSVFADYLHCNYYQKVRGPQSGCTTVSMNVSVIFGNEFQFLTDGSVIGYCATNFSILCQKTAWGERPNPALWRTVDFTQQIIDSGNVDGSYILPQGLYTSTFVITKDLYDNANTYDSGSLLSLPTLNSTGINFGSEKYFFGNVKTDIQATIYEMKYRINLQNNNFLLSSNPSWNNTITPHFTEIGLYDSDKDLIFISKFQRPVLRGGIQQIMIKYDF